MKRASISPLPRPGWSRTLCALFLAGMSAAAASTAVAAPPSVPPPQRDGAGQSNDVPAAAANHDDTPALEAEEKDLGWGITGYPIIMYSPEMKFAAGGGFVLYYARRGLRPSSTEVEFIGSQTKALEINLKPTIYFQGNDYLLSAVAEVKRTPGTRFYGVGPNTTPAQEETYLHKSLGLNLAILRQVVKNVYLGPSLGLAGFRADEVEEGGMLAREAFTGGRAEQAFGAGVSLRVNTTDNDFYPTQGFHSRLDALSYRHEFGSHHDFSQATLDHRHYFSPFEGHVVALQFLATLSSAEVPWQKMPRLGGGAMLRGYYEGRFRDQNYAAAQAEYRFPLVWRFGGAAFAAVGDVAGSVRGLVAETVKAAGGGGLRFLLDSDEHINLRLDAAATDRGDFDFYINLLESF